MNSIFNELFYILVRILDNCCSAKRPTLYKAHDAAIKTGKNTKIRRVSIRYFLL